MPAGICKRCDGPTGNPDGRQRYCPPCGRASLNESIQAHHERKKKARKPGTCKRCGETTGNTDGRQWYCEPCRVFQIKGDVKPNPCSECGGSVGTDRRHTRCDACRETNPGRTHPPSKKAARKPCRECGGEKEFGLRAYCAACLAGGVVKRKAAEHNRANARRIYYERIRNPLEPCRGCGKPNETDDGRVHYCAECRPAALVENADISRERWYDQIRKPCKRCGGEKERRRASQYCLKCVAEAREAAYARRKEGYHGLEAEWREILEGDPCSYCGAPMEHVDHIVPSARGGAHSWDNMTAACGSCNVRKNAKPLLTWLLDELH